MRRIRYCPSVAEVDSQVGATGIDRIDQCPSRAVVVSSEHSSVRTGPFSGQSLDPFSQAPTLVLTPCFADAVRLIDHMEVQRFDPHVPEGTMGQREEQ